MAHGRYSQCGRVVNALDAVHKALREPHPALPPTPEEVKELAKVFRQSFESRAPQDAMGAMQLIRNGMNGEFYSPADAARIMQAAGMPKRLRRLVRDNPDNREVWAEAKAIYQMIK